MCSMDDWLLTNLDEVFGLVLGLQTAVVYWLAEEGRPRAWIVGLVGNALWWGYAFTVETYMLLLPIAVMLVVHIRNLRRSLARERERGAARPVTPEDAIRRLSRPTRDPADVAAVLTSLLGQAAGGGTCGGCGHSLGTHGPHGGCGTIIETGAPCGCDRRGQRD
jgi:hypothetical protein